MENVEQSMLRLEYQEATEAGQLPKDVTKGGVTGGAQLSTSKQGQPN